MGRAIRMPPREHSGDLRTHPIIRVLFEQMEERGQTFDSLSTQSGVSRSTIHSWKSWGNPNLVSLEAVAGALDLELSITKRGEQ
jgi:DNA-binding phage protein